MSGKWKGDLLGIAILSAIGGLVSLVVWLVY